MAETTNRAKRAEAQFQCRNIFVLEQQSAGEMNAARVLRPRSLRPYLSARYQTLRRYENASTRSEAAQTPIHPPPPARTLGFFSRYRSAIIWSTLSLSLGMLVGNLAVHTISPPPMPAGGTHEDDVLIADLNKRIDEEFKVKVLRGKCLGVAKQLKGAEGGWVEILPSSSALERSSDEQYLDNLAGAKGLGVERLFWNRTEHKLVAVVWFGGSLSGWPGVTHGGLLATVLTEKIALANRLANDKVTADAASAAAIPQRLPGTGSHAKMLAPPPDEHPEPAQLSLSYVKPTYANNFHVIRVAPAYSTPEEGVEAAGLEVVHPIGGHEWEATLETTDTRVCVKANAKFAPSTRIERARRDVGQVASRSYAEFKDWLWPSRQRNSQMG